MTEDQNSVPILHDQLQLHSALSTAAHLAAMNRLVDFYGHEGSLLGHPMSLASIPLPLAQCRVFFSKIGEGKGVVSAECQLEALAQN